MEPDLVLAIGLNHDKQLIYISENFNTEHSHAYLEATQQLAKNLGPKIMKYSVKFNNKNFTNILELAETLVMAHKEEVETVINPKPNKTYYAGFLIKNIDYDNNLVEFSDEATLANIVAIIRNIPTLFAFNIKVNNKIYSNVSEVAKTEFSGADYTKSLIIGLTNSFLEDAAKSSKEE